MFGIDDIIGAALKIVDRVIPDPAQKLAAATEMARLKQTGDFKEIETQLEMMRMQTEINKLDAASTDKFQSRWRPYIGWICGSAFAMNYIVGPFLGWTVRAFVALRNHGLVEPFPILDMSVIMPVLLGLLGLGVMRTKEKLEGKA